MDAKITKQRLGVFLSYDWLKILGVIAVAVAALYVLFTMIATRPTIAQVYTVYSYGGLKIGGDTNNFIDRLEGKFSFDILEVEMQNFEEGMMGEQALAARRGMLEGDAVIAADYTEEEDGATAFAQLCSGYERYNIEQGKAEGFYEIPALMAETETYLSEFFDGLEGELIGGKAEESFERKNGKDKRFKTAAQKETGVALERERLIALRDNYLFVKAAFEDGSLETVAYHSSFWGQTEDGTEVEVPYEAEIGVSLKKLTGISDLFYYFSGGDKDTEKLVLLFFDNGYRVEDAKYENWTFLRYLLESYAPAHS